MAVAHEVLSDDDDELGRVRRNDGPDRLTLATAYDPDAKSPRPHFTRERWFPYAFLAGAVAVSVAVGVAVGVTLCRRAGADATESTYSSSDVEARIVEAVGAQARNSDSPYGKALEWMMGRDPMELTAQSPNLVQRYSLAHLYYSAGPFRSCNPPTAISAQGPHVPGNMTETMAQTNTRCVFKKLSSSYTGSSFDPNEYTMIHTNRWLSNVTECEWAGVQCDMRGQVVKLDLCECKDYVIYYSLRLTHLSSNFIPHLFPYLHNFSEYSWSRFIGNISRRTIQSSFPCKCGVP